MSKRVKVPLTAAPEVVRRANARYAKLVASRDAIQTADLLSTAIDSTHAGMWEILVPTIHRVSQRPVRVRFHRVWDARIRAISGGLTLLKPVTGEWVSPGGELFRDRMIPVRFIGTESQARQIVDLTLDYYDELSVLCYRVSDYVILKSQDPEA